MQQFLIYKHKAFAKKIYPLIVRYILSSCRLNNLSNVTKNNFKFSFENIKEAKKISNLNHNGALLPKKEIQKEFFFIFDKFKSVLKKYIKKNYLIHFPIIIRVNNILSNKKNKYSATHPHLDSWAGQPEKSKILSFNIFSSSNSPVLELLEYTGNKKLTLSKKKKYKGVIKNNEFKSIYKSKKGDLIITNPGALHRTSSGRKFRVFLECRYINKNKIKKTDNKNLSNYYYSYKKFFSINNENTKINTKFFSKSNSRFGVDFILN